MPAAHVEQLGIAFRRGPIPMDAVPFRTHDPTERIARAKAHANSKRFGAAGNRAAHILRLADGVHQPHYSGQRENEHEGA